VNAHCPFCGIAAGENRADIVYEDRDIIAFRDIHPKAPTHILIIPRKHIPSVAQAGAIDAAVLGRLMLTAAKVAEMEGLDGAFRLVTNCGARAGQSVFHLHIHLLGGRAMGWPPG
jgi:histidine triad (HIT) family protein